MINRKASAEQKKKRVGVSVMTDDRDKPLIISVKTRVRMMITTSGNADNWGVRVDLSLGAKITFCFHRKFLNIQFSIPNFSLCLYKKIMS